MGWCNLGHYTVVIKSALQTENLLYHVFWYDAHNTYGLVGFTVHTTRLKPKEHGSCLWMTLFPNNHKTELILEIYLTNVLASQSDRKSDFKENLNFYLNLSFNIGFVKIQVVFRVINVNGTSKCN